MTGRDERGSVGALVVTGLCLVLLVVAGSAAVLINWFALARHAQQSAELAALAAVSATLEGRSGCEAARETAARNGSRVGGCRVLGEAPGVVVEVRVEVELTPRLPFGPSSLSRPATAGTA